jgi:hypothetical protein
MRGLSGFILMAAVVLLASVTPADATVTPKSATVKTATPVPTAQPTPCGVSEMPDPKVPGGCKKVPKCQEGQVISYDTKTQQVMCKKQTRCDPAKREQPIYDQAAGETKCIVIPECKDGQSLTLDGYTMSCK